MMDSGIGPGASWSYAVDLRREGVSTLREASAETTVTAKPVEAVRRSDADRDEEITAVPGRDREVRFERDAEIGALLFQVINKQTDEVVFQLPTEIMLNLRKFYAETPPPAVPSFEAAM
ncbi:MAG: flagellar protein FlaG [Salinarimonas sp.]|nr:flagellar protein FlaG [Salinarimonas sp.]